MEKKYNKEEITETEAEVIKKMDLATKISLIQKDIKELVRDEKNKHQNFNNSYAIQ